MNLSGISKDLENDDFNYNFSLGIDPCIPNNHGVRIVHTILNNVFMTVKNETDVRSGLWFAVQVISLH